MCCFSATLAALRRKSKDMLALNEHDNHYTTDEPTIYHTRGEHDNYYTTDEPSIYHTRDEHNHYTTDVVSHLSILDTHKMVSVLLNIRQIALYERIL
jgi:hypothetical protein